jgi:hypothetical protein
MFMKYSREDARDSTGHSLKIPPNTKQEREKFFNVRQYLVAANLLFHSNEKEKFSSPTPRQTLKPTLTHSFLLSSRKLKLLH